MIERMQVAKPSAAYVGASWAALGVGVFSFLLGLWNADLVLNEKGYYLTLLLFGLYSAVSIQKAVRDKTEGIPITAMYLNITWFAVMSSLTLLAVGLWNAEMTLSEKGFYGIAFFMSMFAALVVQKNTRDSAAVDASEVGVSVNFERSAD
jgi:uncharacterized membrane protein YiaA